MKKIAVIIIFAVSMMYISACNEQTCKDGEVYYNPSLVETKAKILTSEQDILKNVANEINKTELFSAIGDGIHTFNITIAVSKENTCKNIELDYKGNGSVKKLLPLMEKFNKAFNNLTYNAASIDGKAVNSSVSTSILIKFKPDGTIEKDWKLVTAASNSMASIESKHPDYFTAAEVMPEIIGGFGELAKGIVYPEEAKKNNIEGKVLVQVYIDENGNVVETEIIKSVGYGCDEVAANAIKNVKFKPAMQHGQKVKSMVVIPIMFKLQ